MAGPSEKHFKRLGNVTRPHGIHGEVTVDAAAGESVSDNQLLYIFHPAAGSLEPVRVESVRPALQKGENAFFVKFVHIADRTSAEQLRDAQVFRDRNPGETDAPENRPELEGYSVLDEHGSKIGTIVEYIPGSAQDVLKIRLDTEEILAPLVDAYITGIDHDNETVASRDLDLLTGLN